MAAPIRPEIPTFRAVWNEQLRDPAPTTTKKVLKAAWNILSVLIPPIGLARVVGWAIGFIAKKLTLPSAWFYGNQTIHRSHRIFRDLYFGPIRDHNREVREQFEITPHHIATPDGARLNAYHFRHRQSDENTETVVFCQSNACFSEQHVYSWLIDKAAARGSVCNFVVFDYRGVVKSRGDAKRAHDLLIDTESAYQFARDALHVAPERMRWYGWSLGGANSANIKALHPECTARYVNERSFSSASEVVWHSIPKAIRPLFFWIPFAWRTQGWNLTAPLDKIKGETLIVFHRDDPTIPFAASARQAALKANRAFQTIELYQTAEQIAEGHDRIVDHHFEDLDKYMANPGQRADDAIADFILPPPAAAAANIA